MVWSRLSMLKIKHTNLTENPTRNYEKNRKKRKKLWKKNYKLERETDSCLDETEIRTETEIEEEFVAFLDERKVKEEEKEIRGCTIKASLSIRPKSRWRE